MAGQAGLVLAQHREPLPVGVGGRPDHMRRAPDQDRVAGITAPGGTSVRSPRMQPLPRREPGMRIAPLPISHKSPMVAPTMVAR